MGYDEEKANRDARTLPKEKGAAPHWIRCTHYQGARRCLLAQGHTTEHQYGRMENVDT